MEAFCDISDLPVKFPRRVISEIASQENFVNFKVKITPSSENGDNFMGEMFRIKIFGLKLNGSSGSLHLMLKLSPDSRVFRELFPVHGFYRKEVYSYCVVLPYFNQLQDEFKILPEDRFKFVKCYKAISEEYKELIVMEDLASDGFKMSSRFETLDWDHLVLVTKNLAFIHAFSFAIKARDPKLFADMASNASNSFDYGPNFKPVLESLIDEAATYIEDEVCKEKFKIFSVNSYDKICQYLEPEIGHPYNVICHGDCWTNNFLFKYEGTTPVDVRTLDWQIIRHTSPVVDIAYMIFLSTDEEIRSKKFTAILDLYYDTLNIRLSQMNLEVSACYPKEVFEKHIHDILPVGLLFTLFCLPLQMSEVGKAPDIVDLIQKTENSKNRECSQICIDRMRGVVRDFVKYGLI